MPWYFYNNRGVLKTEGVDDAIPVGVIIPYTTSATVPVGSPFMPVPHWFLCDGSTFSGVLYPQLATVLGSTTLPNLSTRFVYGAGGTAAVKTTGNTPSHIHTIPNHSHTNTHTHTAPDHNHAYGHKHNSSHYHGSGTYSMDLMSLGNSPVYDQSNSGGSTHVSKGYGSGDRHSHSISGDTGVAIPDTIGILQYEYLNTGDAGAQTSGGSAQGFSPVAGGFTPDGDILPPYLNIYFIIKAVDLSGTYI